MHGTKSLVDDASSALDEALSVQIAAVDNKLSATVRDVNTRIDNILLADRKTTP